MKRDTRDFQVKLETLKEGLADGTIGALHCRFQDSNFIVENPKKFFPGNGTVTATYYASTDELRSFVCIHEIAQ